MQGEHVNNAALYSLVRSPNLISFLLTEGFESGDKQESDSMMHVLLNMIAGVEAVFTSGVVLQHSIKLNWLCSTET